MFKKVDTVKLTCYSFSDIPGHSKYAYSALGGFLVSFFVKMVALLVSSLMDTLACLVLL